jgi:starch-binding outer membrane protein, SusD/RagB family
MILKMKRYIYQFPKVLVVFIVLVFVSCEGYLDEDDYSNLSGDTYFITSEGVESLVNACYSPLRFYYGKEHSLVYSEIGTDIFTAGAGLIENPYAYYTADMTIMGFKGNGQDKNSDYWRYFYLGLNNTNAAVIRVQDSPLPEALKSIREGEVRFLRAFYMWHIVNIWGGVHFSLEETRTTDGALNMTDESVFWEQIIKDLEFAVNVLPKTSTEYGRVTKPAAQALLARSYLYTKDYDKAYKYADSVITQYSFKLENDYAQLWNVNNEQNKEVVWSVIWSDNDAFSGTIIDHQDKEQFDKNEPWLERSPGNQLHLFYAMVYQTLTINGQIPVLRDIPNGRSFNRLIPTKFLIDLYDETIDSRFDATFQSVWYCNTPIKLADGDSMRVGDTAIYISKYPVSAAVKATKDYIYYDLEEFYDPTTEAPLGTRSQNYTMRKFLDPTRGGVAGDVGDQSSKFDCYVFRLAEMHFIAAEAKLMLGDNGTALSHINEIRRRAAIPGKETAMEVTAADLSIDFILDEKAREFAGEYIRWFDLKRTDKLVERVRLHNTDAAPYIQDYHRVRPIPINELNAVSNKDVFHQHTGYN